jgi:hypothetical protein
MHSTKWQSIRLGEKSFDNFVWTHGESNPDLFHAMESFYRYTMGPSRLILVQKSS